MVCKTSKVLKDVKLGISEIADYLSADLLIKDANKLDVITNVSTLDSANDSSISFYTNNSYKQQLQTTNAAIVITSRKYADLVPCNALLVTNPHHAYAKVLHLFMSKNKCEAKVHDTAIIGKNVDVSSSAYVGPYVVIGNNVTIDHNVYIGSGCIIGDNCRISSGAYFYPRVVLYSNVNVGNDCIVHSGAVIGADGFGFALTNDKNWYKVEQLGGVLIGNNVEIGANTTIDCGALDNTVIADGVKLDNQIQIGHNVTIGAHCVAAAQFAVAGSTKIGKYCAFGGASSVAGHLTIADGVNLAGTSVIAQSVDQSGVYASGTGTAIPFKKWRRMSVTLEQLEPYVSKIKKLFRATEKVT